MKLGKKYLLDFVMSIGMILCLCYSVTGALWHEIAGIVLFILFILHMIGNRYWFQKQKQIAKAARNSMERKICFLVDHLVLIDMILLAVTSILIAQEVFCLDGVKMRGIFVKLHHFGAKAGFVLLAVHLGCHWKAILSMIYKKMKWSQNDKVINAVMRGLAVVLIMIGLFCLVERYTKDCAKPGEKADSREPQITPANTEASNTPQAAITEAEEEAGETLDEYLSKLYCSGCGKHCSLLSPRCGRGKRQAEEAEQDYENLYGSAQSETILKSVQSTGAYAVNTEKQNGSEHTDTIIIEDSEDALKELLSYIPIGTIFAAGTYYSLKLMKKRRE